MAIALDSAILVATMMGWFLFGVFTALFLTTTYILIYKRRQHQPLIRPILAVSMLMYFVATMHVMAATVRTYDGFIPHRIDPGPSAYFLKRASFTFLFKTSFYIVQTSIGDAFIVYRLWIIYSGDKRLVIPALVLLAGGLVSGIGSIIHDGKATATTPVFNIESKQWIVSLFVLTLFINAACTTLIAAKIWWSEYQARDLIRSRTLSPVIKIVVESGAIYSITLICLLVSYLCGSWAHYVFLDMVVQIIGIVFSLIIVHIGLGLSSHETTLRRLSFVAATNSRHLGISMRPVHILENESTQDEDGHIMNGSHDVSSSVTMNTDLSMKADSHAMPS